MLSDRHLRIAAYVLGQEIARRQRNAIPIPDAFRDLHLALQRELSQPRHNIVEISPAPPRLVTAAQMAHELGVSKRTIHRRAAREGIPMVGNRYLFERTP